MTKYTLCNYAIREKIRFVLNIPFLPNMNNHIAKKKSLSLVQYLLVPQILTVKGMIYSTRKTKID